MKIYKVYREMYFPGIVIVCARNKEEAKKISNKSFGYADDMVVTEININKPKLIFPKKRL